MNLEAPPGFEPGMEVLQTSALPLGDGAPWRAIPQAGETSSYHRGYGYPQGSRQGDAAVVAIGAIYIWHNRLYEEDLSCR